VSLSQERGEAMYSPKIDEKLIPVLYHTAKAQGVPMTTLVNQLLIRALAQENLPPAAGVALVSYVMFTPDHHYQEQKTSAGNHSEDISKRTRSCFARKTNPNHPPDFSCATHYQSII
jgi:hypothetical protein